jgi:predicted ester cyclase
MGAAKGMASMDIQVLLKARAEAYARRDPAALALTYGADAVVMSPMFPRTQGRASIERTYESLFRIFPDWEMTFEEPCVSGTRAMQSCKIRATHRGDFMGIPGTGRKIEFDCVLILDVENDLVQYERRIYDFTGMLIQIGVLRGKPAV